MSDERLGTIMSALDTPLVVVTAAETQERAGCLVGFHCQSSIEPARYCVRLSKANHTNRVALRSTHLAVHFLPAADLWLAERFGILTGDRTDKFAACRYGQAQARSRCLSSALIGWPPGAARCWMRAATICA